MRYIFILLSMEVAGCGMTPTVYHVPQAEWECMTGTERQTTIEQFEKQEENYADTRAQADKTRQEAEKTKKEAETFAQECRDEPSKCHVTTRRKWGL